MAEQYDFFGGCQEIPTKPKPKNYKQKRNWENRFQRWSNTQFQEGGSEYGACGYGSMCDWCSDNTYGRPCVRALNEYLRNMDKKIDYEKASFEDVWNGRF